VEVIGRRISYALQAGAANEGPEVTVGGSGNVLSLSDLSAAVTLVEPAGKKGYQFFYSAGTLSRVPDNFIFPKMSLITLITS
jgi:hypothetical protein